VSAAETGGSASRTSPIRTPLEPRLERENYMPGPLAIVNNFLLWGGSRVYRHRFGVGINEWRLLGRLATTPGATPAEATVAIGVNKAVLSRAMTTLLDKGLIVTESDRRVRHMYVTPAGADLYQQMRLVAEDRERILLASLTDAEASALRGLLVKMIDQAPALMAYDAAQLDGAGLDDDDPDQPEG